MRHAEIIFALAGQVFAFDPPEGRPSSPDVDVFGWATDDNGTPEAATTGSASVDAANTTLAADAAAGDKQLTLASGSSLARRRRYLVTGADGNSETVEVAAHAGTAVLLRAPLLNDYEAGATFQGTRISIAVSSTWASDTSKISDLLEDTWRTSVLASRDWSPGSAGYRLRWTYTVDGVALMGVSYADLVRYAAKNLCSALDVDRRIPGFIDRLPPDYRQDQGAALIEEAHQAVRFDAMGDGQVLRRIRNTEVLTDLVIYRANLMAIEAQVLAGGANLDALELARSLYTQRYNQLLREPKVPVDGTGGGSSGAAERLPVWRR